MDVKFNLFITFLCNCNTPDLDPVTAFHFIPKHMNFKNYCKRIGVKLGQKQVPWTREIQRKLHTWIHSHLKNSIQTELMERQTLIEYFFLFQCINYFCRLIPETSTTAISLAVGNLAANTLSTEFIYFILILLHSASFQYNRVFD